MRITFFWVFFCLFYFSNTLKMDRFSVLLHSLQPSELLVCWSNVVVSFLKFLLPLSPEDTLVSDLTCSGLPHSSDCGFLVNLAALQRLMAKHRQKRGSQSRFDWKCHTWTEVYCNLNVFSKDHIIFSSLTCTVSPARFLDMDVIFLSSIS